MSKHMVTIEVDSTAPVGERMKRARQIAGMSAEQLGAELGTHRNMVYAWESGAKVPKRMVLMACAYVTGAPAEWLLGADEIDRPTCQYVGAVAA